MELRRPILEKVSVLSDEFKAEYWPQFRDRLSNYSKNRIVNCVGCEAVHNGHPGIGRMKALARSYVYWPGLETKVRSCAQCSAVTKAPVKTTLASWLTTERPWSRLHVDYAGPFQGHYFLVVVDAHSKWPEIFKTDRTTSSATLAFLRQVFAQFGMPEVLVSDNGTQFVSAEFEEFSERNGITHIRSPAYHPQSNGQAERLVDTIKRSLLKIKGEGTTAEALQTFLLSYRSTPNAALGKTRHLQRCYSDVLFVRHLTLFVLILNLNFVNEMWKWNDNSIVIMVQATDLSIPINWSTLVIITGRKQLGSRERFVNDTAEFSMK